MSKTLDKVKAAAAKVASARAELDAAIRAARKDESLRDVAAAAGVSHEQVRKIAA